MTSLLAGPSLARKQSIALITLLGNIPMAPSQSGTQTQIGITQAMLLLVQQIPQKVCNGKQALGKTSTMIPILERPIAIAKQQAPLP